MPGVGDWIGEPLSFVSNFLGKYIPCNVMIE